MANNHGLMMMMTMTVMNYLFIMKVIINMNKPLSHQKPDRESPKLCKLYWELHKLIENNTFRSFGPFNIHIHNLYYSFLKLYRFDLIFRNSVTPNSPIRYVWMIYCLSTFCFEIQNIFTWASIYWLRKRGRKKAFLFCFALSEKLKFHAKFNRKHNKNNNLCSIYDNSHEMKYIFWYIVVEITDINSLKWSHCLKSHTESDKWKFGLSTVK